MTLHRVRVRALVLVLLAVCACNGDKKSTAADSAASLNESAISPAVPVVNTGWDTTEAGPVMLLARQDSTSHAALVLPGLTDSTLTATPVFNLDALSRTPVDLFGRAGLVDSSRLVVSSQRPNAEGCLSWPTGTLAPSPSHGWRFGFRKGMATAIPLDSLEGMSPADSSRVTVEIARIASSVAEGSDPVFRGLPFAVRRAYRLTVGGNSVLVGDVVRKINEEANPREEHLLLIAERPAAGDGQYVAAFESRVAGLEEIVRTNDVLGAVQFVRGAPAIVVTFEYENGGQVALLERTGEKRWRITWRSAYTGC